MRKPRALDVNENKEPFTKDMLLHSETVQENKTEKRDNGLNVFKSSIFNLTHHLKY